MLLGYVITDHTACFLRFSAVTMVAYGGKTPISFKFVGQNRITGNIHLSVNLNGNFPPAADVTFKGAVIPAILSVRKGYSSGDGRTSGYNYEELAADADIPGLGSVSLSLARIATTGLRRLLPVMPGWPGKIGDTDLRPHTDLVNLVRAKKIIERGG